MAILKPEYLRLVLCEWIELHKERGATHALQLGKSSGIPTLLQFNEHSFINPSVGFVFEFTRYFKDRILVVDIEVCPDCRKELDKQLNTEIINAHGVPPKEDK